MKYNSSRAVFPANVDAHRSESDLRAHQTVATIGGAYRHPDQTFVRALGTNIGATFVLAALPEL